MIEVSDEKKEQLGRINPWSGIENRMNIWKSIILLGILFVGFLLTSVQIEGTLTEIVLKPMFTLSDIPNGSHSFTKVIFAFPDVAFIALIVSVIGIFLFRTDLKQYIEEGIEWEMIVFFIGLFVLMGVFTNHRLSKWIFSCFDFLIYVPSPTSRNFTWSLDRICFRRKYWWFSFTFRFHYYSHGT